MEQLLQSLIQVLRGWRRRPVLWMAAAGTLALGIGTTATVFSVLDAAALRPLPLPGSDRLVKVVQVEKETSHRYGVSFHSFHGWRQRSHAFSSLAAHRRSARLVRQGDGADRVQVVEVTEEYFSALSLAPLLGRTLSSRAFTGSQGEGAEVVLSETYWLSHFSGDRHVLGRTLRMDGEPFEVVGVMPRAASLPLLGEADLWIPLRLDVARALQEPVWGFAVVGLLAAGVTEEVAQRDLDAVALALELELPALHRGWGAEVRSLRWWAGGEVRPALFAVFAAALSILLVAGSNVASLALERSMTRREEIETRLALGAGQWQLWRLFLVEGAVLALAGGASGVALASLGIRTVRALAPEALPRLEEVALDSRVLVFTVAVAAVSALLAFSLPAALSSRRNGRWGFGRHITPRRGAAWGQTLLVVAQVALTLWVGFASLLVSQSQKRLRDVSPGFDPRGLTLVGVQLPLDDGRQGPEREAVLRRFLERVESLPGVEAAALSVQPLPLEGGQGIFTFYPPAQEGGQGEEVKALAATVSADYFRALGMPVLRGRVFSSAESWGQSKVVVINAALARRYWPDRNPIGQEIRFAGANPVLGRIIGVVGDTRQVALHTPPSGQIFIPWGSVPPIQRLVLRAGNLAPLLPALRQSAFEEAQGVLFDIRSGDDLLLNALARHRFFTVLLQIAALLVGVLGFVGIYGVVASGVSRRRREIGIRVALGSTPWMTLRRTVLLGLLPVALGLVLGLGGAVFVGQGLGGLLFETPPGSPGTLVRVAVVLVAAGLSACLIPARRAARANPVDVLKAER